MVHLDWLHCYIRYYCIQLSSYRVKWDSPRSVHGSSPPWSSRSAHQGTPAGGGRTQHQHCWSTSPLHRPPCALSLLWSTRSPSCPHQPHMYTPAAGTEGPLPRHQQLLWKNTLDHYLRCREPQNSSFIWFSFTDSEYKNKWKTTTLRNISSCVGKKKKEANNL